MGIDTQRRIELTRSEQTTANSLTKIDENQHMIDLGVAIYAVQVISSGATDTNCQSRKKQIILICNWPALR
jgi:hypothetical protein